MHIHVRVCHKYFLLIYLYEHLPLIINLPTEVVRPYSSKADWSNATHYTQITDIFSLQLSIS